MNRIFIWSLFILFWGCSQREFQSIKIKGSDTEVNLALDLAETFMEKDPDISIAVTGGGSGTGIAALLNQKCDIANSSREFRDSEMKLAGKLGINVIPIVFAIDALAFVVNPSVEVEVLTVEQIAQIFKGDVNNWKEVGGKDTPISLYGRQSNSGTFVFVQQNILKGEYSNKMKQMNGTAQILEAIKADPNAIGYLGIGYIVNEAGDLAEGIKVISVKADEDTTPVNPTDIPSIINGDYVITRPLYQYTNGLPKDRTKAFIAYELSPEGQEIVRRNGYFPITPQYKKENSKYGL
jgi:phosphate transport system substrate-binding protein